MVSIYRGERTHTTTTNRGTTHTPLVAMVRIIRHHTRPTPLPLNHPLAHQRAKAPCTPNVGAPTPNLSSPPPRTPQNKIYPLIPESHDCCNITRWLCHFSPVLALYARFSAILQNYRCHFCSPLIASTRLRAQRTRYVYFWSRYAPFYVRSITHIAHSLHGKRVSMT